MSQEKLATETFKTKNVFNVTDFFPMKFLLSNLIFSDVDKVGSIKYVRNINPDSFDGTHVKYLSEMFMYYNGGFKIDVSVSSTMQQAGKLMLVFIPNVVADKAKDYSMSAAMAFQHKIIDVRQTDFTTVDCDYFSPKRSLEMNESIGCFCIYILNAFVSTASTEDNVSITVYISPKDDLTYSIIKGIDRQVETESPDSVNANAVMWESGALSTTINSHANYDLMTASIKPVLGYTTLTGVILKQYIIECSVNGFNKMMLGTYMDDDPDSIFCYTIGKMGDTAFTSPVNGIDESTSGCWNYIYCGNQYTYDLLSSGFRIKTWIEEHKPEDAALFIVESSAIYKTSPSNYLLMFIAYDAIMGEITYIDLLEATKEVVLNNLEDNVMYLCPTSTLEVVEELANPKGLIGLTTKRSNYYDKGEPIENVSRGVFSIAFNLFKKGVGFLFQIRPSIIATAELIASSAAFASNAMVIINNLGSTLYAKEANGEVPKQMTQREFNRNVIMPLKQSYTKTPKGLKMYNKLKTE